MFKKQNQKIYLNIKILIYVVALCYSFYLDELDIILYCKGFKVSNKIMIMNEWMQIY